MSGDRVAQGIWSQLAAHRQAIGDRHLRQWFAEDSSRDRRFSRQACGLLLDYSKQRIDARALELLRSLAESADLSRWTERMFEGAVINDTEHRAVLHVALRNRGNRPIVVDGADVMPEVNRVLANMRTFSDRVRSGAWRGFTGERIRAVVNIGIGGSDLGPAMAATALRAYRHPELEARFVSNLDAVHLEEALDGLEAASTLFVIVSKTFGTQETLTNALSARRWLVEALGDEAAVSRHFVAVSTHRERVAEFGIDPTNMFGFWDWVGGRYSLWSAVGLSLAVLIGMDRFEELLQGGHDMDEHFRDAPWEDNLPVILGLLGIWNNNLLAMPSHVVLPYDYALRRFPDYLQQLEMESNGKRATRDGAEVDLETCPVLWGGPGNNGQHAFYQLMHQGTPGIATDFIVAAQGQCTLGDHQHKVLANAFAQAEALMRGRNAEEARAELVSAGLDGADLEAQIRHRVMPGNRPSTTILYPRLTPRVLGALIALYEHKVFVQSVCWNINAFDQWGVELGKQLAGRILPELTTDQDAEGHDCSTNGLINTARRWMRQSS